jgi:hypothetical protein
MSEYLFGAVVAAADVPDFVIGVPKALRRAWIPSMSPTQRRPFASGEPSVCSAKIGPDRVDRSTSLYQSQGQSLARRG